MPRDQGEQLIASNKKARHDYTILDTYEAGMVLTGSEVKSLREGRATLADGYAYIDRGEMWIDNVHIPQYLNGTWTNHAPKRKRKLLLHRQEIIRIGRGLDSAGTTLVPLKLYFKDGRVKVEIALAKGKREYDKRQTLRERQDQMDAKRAMARINRRNDPR
ncbi:MULTISPECIES: SsrA-binding protein SmpB [unclassified Pseudoclavibacter]|uniref:SsrA-binding protein SmpB n=1 Tax=unclassified Pseudoclavibacter TaxID=2615177 RepID=UPI0013018B47|nr:MULTISPECIES: SsrA-binding protein SmpB [unclassified Pseudoclavibacter]KAB1657084.1 SsrA-binding protein SmpB [Pseudoclavibacter sp. CFCC 11306]KAB1659896.1 SsrA-binding protein SmpB [Pseudoclavibacter sp. CFCC 13796]